MTAAPVNVAGATATELDGGTATDSTGGGAAAEAAGVSVDSAGGEPPKVKVFATVSVAAGGGTKTLDVAAAGVGATGVRACAMAFSMYLSIVLGLLVFWLMTIAIPFWQWLV